MAKCRCTFTWKSTGLIRSLSSKKRTTNQKQWWQKNPNQLRPSMETEKTPPPAVEPWHRSRMLLRNPVSLAGVALAIVSIANIFIFFLIDQIAAKPSPYVGILAYMVSPGFLILGLLLILVGLLIERRKKVESTEFYPR